LTIILIWLKLIHITIKIIFVNFIHHIILIHEITSIPCQISSILSTYIHVAQFHPCHWYHPCEVNFIHLMMFNHMIHPCAQFQSWVHGLFLNLHNSFISVMNFISFHVEILSMSRFTKTSCEQMFVNHVIQPRIDELHNVFHTLNIKFKLHPMTCKSAWCVNNCLLVNNLY
jgi:membrane protein insertase Oxa1/YidC/SpoIIIJ